MHRATRVGLFNIPMTYPAPVVDGWSVSGMLTPEGGGENARELHAPEGTRDDIVRAGGYEIDIEVDYDEDWKSTAIIERLSRNLALQTKSPQALARQPTETFRSCSPCSRRRTVSCTSITSTSIPDCEHYNSPEAAPIRERAWAFFDEMDEVIGDLIDWAGAMVTS